MRKVDEMLEHIRMLEKRLLEMTPQGFHVQLRKEYNLGQFEKTNGQPKDPHIK